jgi:hypothetical protein
MNNTDSEDTETMFDRQFYQSRLGLAAIASIAAMLAFNVFALSQQLQAQPVPLAVAKIVELA